MNSFETRSRRARSRLFSKRGTTGMDVKEETEIALKDAYWAEIRKLYENYLHSVSISEEKQAQVTAAGERYKQGLALARQALDHCLALTDEVLKS
jgi:hypothetical protein